MQSTTTNYGSKFCRLYLVVEPADGVKVAYLGNHEPEFSTEQDVAKAFRSLDWEVIELQENRATWQQAREAGLASDLLLFTSTWETAQPFYETLETLRLCAMRGISDSHASPGYFWGSDRGARKWYVNPMFYCRYVLTADGGHQDDWMRLGVDHRWLRPGCCGPRGTRTLNYGLKGRTGLALC